MRKQIDTITATLHSVCVTLWEINQSSVVLVQLSVACFTFHSRITAARHSVPELTAPKQHCTTPPPAFCVQLFCLLVEFSLLLLLLLIIFFTIAALCLSYPAKQLLQALSSPNMLSPRWPRLLATTGPLSGLPAQVAWRFYLHNPHHGSPYISQQYGRGGAGRMESCVFFRAILSFWFMGKDASQSISP